MSRLNQFCRALTVPLSLLSLPLLLSVMLTGSYAFRSHGFSALTRVNCVGVRPFSRWLSTSSTATPRRSSRYQSLSSTAVTIDNPPRVRFAPSPTGSLHIGGARTAMFNWLLARKHNGTFIVRVEDTDEERSTRASEESILADLRWMGLHWDEGPGVDGPFAPYRQSERKSIYRAAADKLLAEGKAYRCFCSEEELDAKRIAAEEAGEDPKYDGTWRDAPAHRVEEELRKGTPHTIRFRVPDGSVVSIDDVVRGRVTWDASASLGDFILLRSNGMPVYNFCVSVDDAHMGISHVIRAEEHLTNTLRQVLILQALQHTPPVYAHCSLILGADRSKLSKRHGATSVKQFSEQGFLPAAMLNYLANLGWNDGTNKEIYSPAELTNAFDLNRIVKSSAVFDMNKLIWINAQHCRALPEQELLPIVEHILCTNAVNPTAASLTGNVTDPMLSARVLREDWVAYRTALTTDSDRASIDRFLKLLTKIAQRDMDLLTDARRLVLQCLRYDFEQTLQSADAAVHELVLSDTQASDSLMRMAHAIVRDVDAGVFPNALHADFEEQWKAYVKTLGTTLSLKGKRLYHPLRLLLTGRMSGPEISDQLALLALAQMHVRPQDCPQAVFLSQRIDSLRGLTLQHMKQLVESGESNENE